MKRLTGIVKWFNDGKGYGFIRTLESDTDIFVHYTSISGDGFKTLSEGQSVEFEMTIERTALGRTFPQAKGVVKL